MQDSLPPETNCKPSSDSPWNHFGVRHFLVWMTGIAIMGGIVRGLMALENAYDQTGSVDMAILGRFLQAWPMIRLGADDLTAIFVYGSIFGLGIPAAMSKPVGSEFWNHPGRVHFALACALTALAILVQLLATGVFGTPLRSEEVLCRLGGFGTAGIWSLYALLRSRTRMIWRLAILWILVSIGTEFYFSGWEILLNRQNTFASQAIVRLEQYHVIASITCGFTVVITMFAAGIIELTIGKYRDWRVWSMTLLLPIAYIVASWGLYYELWRAYKLGGLL